VDDGRDDSNPFPASFDQFGYSVALDGNELFIGCPGDETVGSDKGAVYVYRRVSGTWTLIDTLTAPGYNVGCRMGEAVDVSGGSALVGVPRFALPGHSEQGVTLVYKKGVDGHWSYNANWGAGKPDGSRTGAAVSISLPWASYSAPGEQTGGAAGVGTVTTLWNYEDDGSGQWELNLPQVAVAGEASVTGFGASVVNLGGAVAVGATGGSYRAFYFDGDRPLVKIPARAEANSALGSAIAVSGPQTGPSWNPTRR
jgi:hypothetical protein